jgi:hypothetical protein
VSCGEKENTRLGCRRRFARKPDLSQLIRTGSAQHNTWLAGYAISKGMRLKYSEGLIKDGKVIAGETEESAFTTLGFPYQLPLEREMVENKPAWLQQPPVGSQ